ncbi:carbohydrate porin [Pseudomonas gingeri]|uniref:carbohydrate porin n=1 Tax=Pseudomonas gingeri TaxID=117681 RepID=UPI0015A26D5C|nr:carbohydrate porin [Pseudomonas gingeri]NWA28543.1 carbohydrate porin [Pseudomonas gingeri]NWD71187.1 carbohydrate porin [Pseudomonas gingeri]
MNQLHARLGGALCAFFSTAVPVTCFADALQTPWPGMVQAAPGLLGDMGGLRSSLAAQGFTFQTGYMNEAASNLSGGADSHNHYLSYGDEFHLMFQQDFQRVGIADGAIEGLLVQRNGNDDLTLARVVDPRLDRVSEKAQEGLGPGSILRLGWLTWRQSFLDRRLLWRVGLLNKVQDFSQTNECDFQLLQLCGGQAASATWPNWNVHLWGTSLQYRLTDELTIKTAVYKGNTSHMSSNDGGFSTASGGGYTVPLELAWQTEITGRKGQYELGAAWTSMPVAERYWGENGGAGWNDPNGYRQRGHSTYAYFGLQQDLTVRRQHTDPGISWFMSGAYADPSAFDLEAKVSTGLRIQGPFAERRQDKLGIGFTWLKGSPDWARSNREQNTALQAEDFDNPLHLPVNSYEVDSEVFYRFNLAPWLYVQPGIQYWHQPGGVSQTDDVVIAELRTGILF